MFMNIVQTFSDMSKENPWVGMLAVPVLGYIGYAARSLPSKILNFIKHRFLISIALSDSNMYNNTGNLYNNIFKWYNTTRCARWVKTFRISSNDAKQVVPGPGVHFMWFEGWPYILKVVEIESKSDYGADHYNRVTITALGRSSDKITRLVERFSENKHPDNVRVHTLDHDGDPRNYTDVPAIPLRDMPVAEELKTGLLSRINEVMGNSEWYTKRCIPQKATFLLHGEAGTGKTSLVRGLAREIGYDVYSVDLSRLSNDAFANAFKKSKPNSIILIEDIDASTNSANTRETDEQSDAPVSNSGKLTLSGLLNTLDGLVTIDKRIVIITTNYPERLDPALMRRGRVDLVIEVGRMGHDEIDQFMCLYYDKTVPHDLSGIKACDVHGLFLEYPHDIDGFVQGLQEIKSNE